MRHILYILLALACSPVLANAGLASSATSSITLGLEQGEMAGEVTDHSVILQTRLTTGMRQQNGEINGASGFARFVISKYSDFSTPFYSPWQQAQAQHDHIVKPLVGNLEANTRYFYRVEYKQGETSSSALGDSRQFKTLAGKNLSVPVSFVHATCMNYQLFFNGTKHFPWYRRFLIGKEGISSAAYEGHDIKLGYPALEAISNLKPDFVIFNGDNLYYDAGEKDTWADDKTSMRYRWHRQLSVPRFKDLLSNSATYWTKDDHDFRFDDGDLSGDQHPLPQLGIDIFKEQVPVVNIQDENAITYRTQRVSKELELWFLEGRDYRSPNDMEDGPNKTIWGDKQKAWLKSTLLASDATFKLIISPTPVIGPDRATKKDNHANPDGFWNEGQSFINWLAQQKLQVNGTYLLVGDRHWQYHSIHPSGVEEFSAGSMSYINAQPPATPGGFLSSDPDEKIIQPYVSPDRHGGFMQVNVNPAKNNKPAELIVRFIKENGDLLHELKKLAKQE